MNCAACNKKLERLFPTCHNPNNRFDGWEGALEIKFDGGFEIFVDVDCVEEAKRLRVLICEACATQLCETTPWIAKLLKG